MAELYPNGTAGVRAPSVLATVLALTAALVLGAGALVDDDAVTTVVKTVEAPQVRTDATAPTGSLAGTSAKSVRTDAAQHAATIQRLGARDSSTAGTPADGDAAVAAGTAVKDEAAVAAALAQEQDTSATGVSAGAAAKDEANTAAAIGNP